MDGKARFEKPSVLAAFLRPICAAAGTTVIVTHQVAHVVEVGYSQLLAASIFGFAGITSSFGRVVFGFHRRSVIETSRLYA